jgi:hypothetical protein
MKTLLFSLAAVLALAACTTVEQSTRISTDLKAMEFNSVATHYMEKPTFVSTRKMSDGSTFLVVHMDTYAPSHEVASLGLSPEATESLKYLEICFSKENAAGYVGAIDKYLEWAALASARKDAFTKEIAQFPAGGTATLLFTFHSGNDQEHFLVIGLTSSFGALDNGQCYDVSNAKKLRSLLLAFASDSLPETDIDSVYK